MISPWYATVANSETLADAIAAAYQSNPTLQSQRAQLRAVDETYVQAEGGWGPQVSVQAAATYNDSRLPVNIETNDGAAEIAVSQPIYTGGRVASQVDSVDAQVRAGREASRAAEGGVMLQVITAYADVQRDQQVLAVHRQYLEILSKQLSETEERKRGGELTRTDVLQAETQVDSERALLAAAQGQLQISRSEYAAVVGQNPGDLAPEPPLPGFPSSVDQAFDAARANNPGLRQALFNEVRSRALVVEARSAYRPTVTVNGSFGYSSTLAAFGQITRDRSLVGQVVISMPIFTSGVVESQVREALEQNTSDRVAIEIARRAVVQNVANAWNQILAQKLGVDAQEKQVQAAAPLVDDMSIEYKAGLRSELELLNADQILISARLSLLSAQHDKYVSTANLLFQMGALEARDLIGGLELYDPAEHLNRVEPLGLRALRATVGSIDRLGAPAADQQPIPAPAAAVQPHLAPADTAIADDAGFADVTPITPIPGTVSPAPQLGQPSGSAK